MLAPSTQQRPPKPPLTSMPSTPGPEFPGGYPRNSVVFAENKWDRKGPGAGSYFPDQPLSSSQTSTPNATAPSTPSANSYPLNTDGSVSSNLSTRALAGSSPAASSRGTLTPVPSDFSPVPVRDSVSSASDWSQASATGDTPTETEVTSAPTQHGDDEPHPAPLHTEPLPAVAPLADISAFAHIHGPGTKANSKTTPTAASPTSSDSSTSPSSPLAGSNTPSTAPSSPVSPVSVKSKSPNQPTTSTASSRLLGRFASVRRGPGHRKAASESTKVAPSAFGTGPRRGHPSAAAGAGTDVELGDGVTLPSLPSSTSSDPTANAKPRRTHSLMRTLRGEAKVLAGKVTRDAGKVQEGKRMVREA